MPVITLPHPKTVDNAPANASEVATMVRDALNPPVFVGPHPVAHESCTMCGRTPPTGRLYKIIVDVIRNDFVLIGIDVCATQHLLNALNDVLSAERLGAHRHKAARIRRLEDAMAAIDR
jgi:hypothetical protein